MRRDKLNFQQGTTRQRLSCRYPLLQHFPPIFFFPEVGLKRKKKNGSHGVSVSSCPRFRGTFPLHTRETLRRTRVRPCRSRSVAHAFRFRRVDRTIMSCPLLPELIDLRVSWNLICSAAWLRRAIGSWSWVHFEILRVWYRHLRQEKPTVSQVA